MHGFHLSISNTERVFAGYVTRETSILSKLLLAIDGAIPIKLKWEADDLVERETPLKF